MDVLEGSAWSLNDAKLLIFLQSSGAVRRFSFLVPAEGLSHRDWKLEKNVLGSTESSSTICKPCSSLWRIEDLASSDFSSQQNKILPHMRMPGSSGLPRCKGHVFETGAQAAGGGRTLFVESKQHECPVYLDLIDTLMSTAQS